MHTGRVYWEGGGAGRVCGGGYGEGIGGAEERGPGSRGVGGDVGVVAAGSGAACVWMRRTGFGPCSVRVRGKRVQGICTRGRVS